MAVGALYFCSCLFPRPCLLTNGCLVPFLWSPTAKQLCFSLRSGLPVQFTLSTSSSATCPGRACPHPPASSQLLPSRHCSVPRRLPHRSASEVLQSDTYLRGSDVIVAPFTFENLLSPFSRPQGKVSSVFVCQQQTDGGREEEAQTGAACQGRPFSPQGSLGDGQIFFAADASGALIPRADVHEWHVLGLWTHILVIYMEM